MIQAGLCCAAGVLVMADPEPGTLFAGDYRVERRLKTGGMGTVFVAKQESTGQLRAVKLMHAMLVGDDKHRARFVQEAKVAGRIKSDHVVQTIAAGIDAATGIPWIAMELLEGEDLAARLQRQGPLAAAEVRDVLEQLCDALSDAHAAGVVHRDLKPENVFLEARPDGAPPRVKVLDFGIAKVIADAGADATAAIGTPHWMAPEQTAAGTTITPQTDLWPLGLVAFRLLTGKLFWKAANERPISAMSILREVGVEPLVPASERAAAYGLANLLPRGFDAWFARCVARAPEDRFTDAAACRAALAEALATSTADTDAPRADAAAPIAVETPGVLVPSLPRTRMRRSWLGVVAAAAVMAGAVVALRATSGGRARAPSTAPAASSTPPTIAPPASAAPAESAKAAPWQVPLGSSPTKGSPAALVTIVQFADFQCPLSKSTAPVLDRLLDELGPDLRVVWKEDPLAIHPRAEAAALLAREALAQRGASGFWAAHDRLFALQPDLDDVHLEAAAAALGLDAGAVRVALAEQKYLGAIDADLDLADGLAVSATPTLFVNGRRLEGPQKYDALRAIVDEELLKARALVAGGLAPADVYAEVLKRAQPPREPERRAVDPVRDMTPLIGGGAEGQIVFQEFCDYEDAMCRRIAPTVMRVLERYGDRVLFEWRDAPRPEHSHARLAAAAAREAFAQKSTKGFVSMHDLLFEKRNGLERAALDGYAKAVGLDLAAFGAALDGGAHDGTIDYDARAAEKAGIVVLPAFVVGPYFLEGMTSFRTFTKLVDRALADATSDGGAP
jgi:protein-disulfide isomerase/tRNA A-37 threonylcarbamoyl transferase component Bud32